MSDETPSGQFVRLMATQDPNKAYAQLAGLVRDGNVAHGMVVAELTDGRIHVLGQRATAEDMAKLLLCAVEALKRVPTEQRGPLSKAKAKATGAAPATAPAAGYPPTIAGQWDSLADAIFDSTTPPIQVSECRRSFYAGAAALLRLQMNESDPGLEATEADLDRMTGWSDEIAAFGDDLMAGRT